MPASGGDRRELAGLLNPAHVYVVAPTDDDAIGPQTTRMPMSGGDRREYFGWLSLAVAVVAPADDGAIGPQTTRMQSSGR